MSKNNLSGLLSSLNSLNTRVEQLTLASVQSLIDSANLIGKSWSGSHLGYHARVYYKDFHTPPPGAHFSIEWGFEWAYIGGTTGEWGEYSQEAAEAAVYAIAGNPDTGAIEALSTEARGLFRKTRQEALSKISVLSSDFPSDEFLQSLKTTISELNPLNEFELEGHYRPRGKFMSRDSKAIGQGIKTPPHIRVLAWAQSIIQPFMACQQLAEAIESMISHSNEISKSAAKQRVKKGRPGYVFIGHGRSKDWFELQNFLKEELGLKTDEFNRIPSAGFLTMERIEEMLEEAAFAFLVMTAEDKMPDGEEVRARQNVIHEIGLFQGRLGRKKAIILLEEGCEDFSNVHGLGHIPFPKNRISATFDTIRRTLKREGMIS